MIAQAPPQFHINQARLQAAVVSTLHDAEESMYAGDYSIALRLFDKIIRIQPYNVIALMKKGYVYDLQGNYSEAIRTFGSVISTDPGNAEAWYNQGMALKKIGAVDEGLSFIRRGMMLSMGII